MTAAHAAFALFDDNLDGRGDLLLDVQVERIVCTDRDGLEHAFSRIEAAGRAGHWVALAAGYELGACFGRHAAPDDVPLLTAWVFARGRTLSAAETGAFIAEPVAALHEHAPLPGLGGVRTGMVRAPALG